MRRTDVEVPAVSEQALPVHEEFEILGNRAAVLGKQAEQESVHGEFPIAILKDENGNLSDPLEIEALAFSEDSRPEAVSFQFDISQTAPNSEVQIGLPHRETDSPLHFRLKLVPTPYGLRVEDLAAQDVEIRFEDKKNVSHTFVPEESSEGDDAFYRRIPGKKRELKHKLPIYLDNGDNIRLTYREKSGAKHEVFIRVSTENGALGFRFHQDVEKPGLTEEEVNQWLETMNADEDALREVMRESKMVFSDFPSLEEERLENRLLQEQLILQANQESPGKISFIEKGEVAGEIDDILEILAKNPHQDLAHIRKTLQTIHDHFAELPSRDSSMEERKARFQRLQKLGVDLQLLAWIYRIQIDTTEDLGTDSLALDVDDAPYETLSNFFETPKNFDRWTRAIMKSGAQLLKIEQWVKKGRRPVAQELQFSDLDTINLTPEQYYLALTLRLGLQEATPYFQGKPPGTELNSFFDMLRG